MLLITHYDLDGSVSEIVLSKFIKFDKTKASGYSKFSKYIDELKKDEEVIFSDVSLTVDQVKALINKTHNFIIIDHHPDTAKLILEFPEFRDKIFFDGKVCGAILCKRYVEMHYSEAYANLWTPYLDELVTIADVYDIWRIDNKLWSKAYNLDILYWHHSHHTFVQVFRNGYALSDDDKNVIKSALMRKSKLLKEAEKFEVGINTLFVICSRDICNDFSLIYGTKYDMFFLVSADERSQRVDISLRSALPLADFSTSCVYIKKKFPDDIISAGGHPQASGITLNSGITLQTITDICDDFSTHFSNNLVPF